METQEQVRAMDGKEGSEDGMLLNGTFYTMSQWAEVVEEINVSLTQTGAKRMLKKAKAARMTWRWVVTFSRFNGGQYGASQVDVKISEL